MAKFKLRPEFIAGLTSLGFIKNGVMKLRVPHRTNRLTGETRFEIEFAADAVIETSNEFAIECMQGQKPPVIKKNGQWVVGDPSLSLFVTVPDADLTATSVIDQVGVAIPTRKEEKLLTEYSKKTNVAIPSPKTLSNLAPYIAAAKAHAGHPQ